MKSRYFWELGTRGALFESKLSRQKLNYIHRGIKTELGDPVVMLRLIWNFSGCTDPFDGESSL